MSSFDRDLKSLLVYEIECNGCGSIYVGRTSRHLTTRMSEQQKKDSQVEQHIVKCSSSTNEIEWKILDAFRSVEKLIATEAIFIIEAGNKHTHNEYRWRQ